MLISTLFSIITYSLLKKNFTIIQGEIAGYLAISEYNNNIIMIFNMFREFLFDKIIYVEYMELEEYLNNELSNFYMKTINTTNIINENRIYFPKEFDDKYELIQNHDLCGYSQEFFDKTITEDLQKHHK